MSLIRQVRPRHEAIPYSDKAGHLRHVHLTVFEVWADGRLIAETADPEAIPSILRHPSAAGELPPSSRPVGEVEPPAEHDSQPAAPSHPPHDSPLGAMVLVLLAMCLIYAGIAWWVL
jgi:hypothetical protein